MTSRTGKCGCSSSASASRSVSGCASRSAWFATSTVGRRTSSTSATSACPSVRSCGEPGKPGHSVTRCIRRAARSRLTTSIWLKQSGSARSITRQAASADCSVLASQGNGCSTETGGRSTSCSDTSCQGSIPGSGNCVVCGYGPLFAPEPVSRACNVDLPELGGPSSATCAAPSGRTTSAGELRAPPRFGAASSSSSSWMRRFRSACRWSVPLCLGITRSISRRHSSRSWGSRALRSASAAALYSGVRLAGMPQEVSGIEVFNVGRMCQVMDFRHPALQRGKPRPEDSNDER